jgi:hypothetical protein
MYPAPTDPEFSNLGDQPRIAANQSGQLCVGDLLAQLQLNADGSQAYFLSYASLKGFAVGGATTGNVAIDDAGNCYLATYGTITATPGAYQNNKTKGNAIIKFDPTGKILFATYLGGSGTDVTSSVTLDQNGNIWITGSTSSNDFPTTQNAIAKSFGGGNTDAFIAELSADGTSLLYGTYLGGSGDDAGASITLDASGSIYVAGKTTSNNFPTKNPLESQLQAAQAAFITKIDSSGNLVYSTFLGMTSNAAATGIAVDSNSAMYVTGTASAGFPLVNPLQGTNDNSSFIAQLNPAGSALVYSTYFGTGNSGFVIPYGIRSTADGTVYIGGSLEDCNVGYDMPTIPLVNAIQTTPYGGYLAVIDTNGNLLFSSYFGTTVDCVHGQVLQPLLTSIAIDGAGDIFTGAVVFPLYSPPLLDPIYGTMSEAFPLGVDWNVWPFASKVSPTTGYAFAMPSTLDFSALPIGFPSQAQFSIYNVGTIDIALTDIAISTGDFSQTNNCPSTLVVGSDCLFTVTFTPSVGGPRTGAITITDSAPGSPHIIQLTGVGNMPTVLISPTSLSFGQVPLGNYSQLYLTIQNTGWGNLLVSGYSASKDFSWDDPEGACAYITQGGYCTLTVTFQPSATGTRNGTLTITDNATNSPQTVPLTGIGDADNLGLEVPSGGSSSATVAAGSSANYTLSIGGQGTSGTATLSCSGAPAGASCTVPASENISATSTSQFTVTVTTTARTSSSIPASQKGSWSYAFVIFSVLLVSSPRSTRLGRLALPLLLLALICSCGGSGSTSMSQTGTPAGTYTLNIQATMGSTQSSVPLTLIVR